MVGKDDFGHIEENASSVSSDLHLCCSQGFSVRANTMMPNKVLSKF